jgi:hypothetical protein
MRKINLKKASVGLREDDIVETDIFPEEELSVADIKEIVEAIVEVSDRRMMPQLIVAGELSGPDLDAMRYLAKKESSPTAIAEAYVIRSLSQKIIGKFYLSINKPARPTKMFGKEEDALDWLKEEARKYWSKQSTNKKT